MPRGSTAASTTPTGDGRGAGCGPPAATGRRGSRKAARARCRSPSISSSAPTRSPIEAPAQAHHEEPEAPQEALLVLDRRARSHHRRPRAAKAAGRVERRAKGAPPAGLRARMMLAKNRKFADSPLEGTGFEPSVPREKELP